MRRRTLLAGAGLIVARRAGAQGTYPDRPIRLIVPFGPGSAIDAAIRTAAPHMTATLGQPLVIENRAGGTGAIGAEFVSRARPDGYTLVMGSVASHAILAATMPHLPYDILRDFVAIGLLTNSWTILVVNKDVPATDLASFAAWTRTQPAPVSYASGGIGGVTHLAAELVRLRTGARLNHVPYRDAGQGITDTMAGHVQMMVYPASVVPLVKSGALRALAVLAPNRLPALPGVPTAIEQGFPDLVASGWQGLFAPARTPDAIRDRLAAALHGAAVDPDVSARLVAEGFDPDPASTPEGFAQFVAGEIARWKQIAHSPGVQLQG